MKLILFAIALPLAAQSFEQPYRYMAAFAGGSGYAAQSESVSTTVRMPVCIVIRGDGSSYNITCPQGSTAAVFREMRPEELPQAMSAPPMTATRSRSAAFAAPMTAEDPAPGETFATVRDPAAGGSQGIPVAPVASTAKPVARAASLPPVSGGGVWAYASKIALATSAPIYGVGRDVGGWNLTACNDRLTAVNQIDAGRVLAAFPELSALTSLQADDALARKAAADPRSRFVRILDAASKITADGFLIGGAATDTNWALIAGYAAKGLMLLYPRALQNAPNPEPHRTELLPAEISLSPGQCKTYTVFSSLIRNARNLERRDIPMPLEAAVQ